MKPHRFFILYSIAFIFCTGNINAQTNVTFLPQWIPQAQFAGYYVAYEKGLYTKNGLNVTILRGGPERPAMQFLNSGQADIVTTFLSTAIQQRTAGVELINIAQLVQKSSLILVAKKTSGITTVTDLNGKKVGVWPEFSVQPQALFRKFNLNVTVVPQSMSPTLFLHNGIDVASAMWYNEYHTILNSGYNADELMIFFYDDYGLNFPEDGIYCLKKTVLQDRERCQKFVQASFEGWHYAFDHEEETLDIIMHYVNEAKLPTNRVHQRWMLKRMHDIIFPETNPKPMGTLSREDYATVAEELKCLDMIPSIPKFEEFYENCSPKQ